MYVTHICKCSLRINAGFLYTENRKELHMNTYSCFWKFSSIYPARKWGSLTVLSLVLDPRCFFVFFHASCMVGWIKASTLKLVFFSSVLCLSSFVSQVKKIETLVSKSSCIQSLSFPTFRDYLQSGHFLVSLLSLTFLFFHSLCTQCLSSPVFFLPFFSSNCLKFNILSFFLYSFHIPPGNLLVLSLTSLPPSPKDIMEYPCYFLPLLFSCLFWG